VEREAAAVERGFLSVECPQMAPAGRTLGPPVARKALASSGLNAEPLLWEELFGARSVEQKEEERP
jgi:hypothetical protein